MPVRQAQHADVTAVVPEMSRARPRVTSGAVSSEGYWGNQTALRRLSRTTPQVQRKLAIGAVNDPLEAEADRVADHIMRMPDAGVSLATAPPQIGCKCASCEEEEKQLQPKSAGTQAPAEAPPGVENVLRSSGQPLDRDTRSFFESRLGHDLGAVRIHHDPLAADSAKSVNALAYTVGRDIVFGAGQYAPSTQFGRHLLAHELTHTLQQSPSRSSPPLNSGLGNDASTHGFAIDVPATGNQDVPRVSPAQSNAAVQRMGDPSQAPMVLPCQIASGSAPPSSDFVLFPNNESTLTPTQQVQIAQLVVLWNALDVKTPVQVDGYASNPGGETLNWQLSCSRASAVSDELKSPSTGTQGIPAESIQVIMHGRTSEFGSEELNRRASIDLGNSAQPQFTPGQPTPTQPTTPAPPDASGATDCKQDPSCAKNPNCPDEYCLPFATRQEALDDRAAKAESVLSSIGTLNSRAVPLFREFIFGGGPARDISAEFATDFTNTGTTRAMAQLISKMLEDALKASPPTFPPGANSVILDIKDVLDQSVINGALDDNDKGMVFDDVFSVPGLIAGGIGKTQESCKVGANTQGAQNDSRSAQGTVVVTRKDDGTLLLATNLTFTVVDTLDFCPGNCGGSFAQKLTVPMSRWEATCISGDIPFTVRFGEPVGAFDSEE